jgi:four helix bundle protein
MQDFKKLKVWEQSHRVALDIYKATRAFPKEEMFALTSQMRRAAQSVSANIAEGCCRNGDTEFARFLYIAMGSASELECHLLLARDLGLLPLEKADKLQTDIESTKRLLAALIRKLKADSR